jgi:hypothetical protein
LNPVRTVLLATAIASLAVAQDPATNGTADGIAKVHELQQQYSKLQAGMRKQFADVQNLPESEREAAGDRIYGEFQEKAEAIADRIVAIVTDSPTGELALAAIDAALGMDLSKANRAIVVEALADHHANTAKIAALLPKLRYMPGRNIDRLLDKVLADNPDKGAKGSACMVMAQRASAEDKRGELLERCVAEFADVQLGSETIGKIAGRQLNALRNIKIGKTPPDIVGKDMDGNAFKLGDYRGKVVVLDFWGYW